MEKKYTSLDNSDAGSFQTVFPEKSWRTIIHPK